MDLTSSLTVIGITCLAVAIHAYSKGVNNLIIVGTLAVAIGAGLLIIGRHVGRHNRPVRSTEDIISWIENVVVWTAIVSALGAIIFVWFFANGLPPKDYFVLFGVIAVGLVGFIIAIKYS